MEPVFGKKLIWIIVAIRPMFPTVTKSNKLVVFNQSVHGRYSVNFDMKF